MSKFKVGDKVRCINNIGRGSDIKEGKSYRVSHTLCHYGSGFIRVDGDPHEYSEMRFEKVIPNGGSR